MKSNLLFMFVLLGQFLSAQPFTEAMSIPFDTVSSSSVAFADIDGDNDQDLLITGSKFRADIPIAKLYTNDGQGDFTEVANHPFEATTSAAVAIADIDGDSDPDVLLTGLAVNPFRPIAKLYTNDGQGNFSEVANTPFISNVGAAEFADVDGDNDMDLLLTGTAGSIGDVAKLYTNDSLGNFTEVANTPFLPVNQGAIAFADVDSDNDQDVLITGFDASDPTWVATAKLYTNSGQGDFTEIAGLPFAGVAFGTSAIAFADVDNDDDPDVLITGFVAIDSVPVTSLYINDTPVSPPTHIGLSGGAHVEFGLYPNPTKADKLHVGLDSREHGWISIQVFDLYGRLLKQQRERSGIGQQTFSIDIASLNIGSYIIQLDDGKRKGMAKFMVQ